MASDSWRVLAVAVLVAVAFGGVASGGPQSSAEPISPNSNGAETAETTTADTVQQSDAGDTKANATEIQLGETVSGEITNTEEDWYKLDVPAGVVVTISGDAGRVEFDGEVYDGSAPFEVVSEDGGTLFIKVQEIGPCIRFCSANYSIGVTAAGIREPLTNATEIELGETVSGQVEDGQADWYKVDVPAGAIVSVDGGTEAFFEGSKVGERGAELLTETNGTLFVREAFVGTCLRPPCTRNYTLTVTAVDARERNDDLDSAIRIDRNTTFTDNLSVDRPFPDEIDTYAFGLTAGDQTRVTFDRDTPDGVTLLRVVGPDGETVASRYVASTGLTTIRVDAEQDGTYRVQAVVVSDRPREGIDRSEPRVINYTLSLDTTPGVEDAPRFTRDEFALAKYDLLFSEVSVETKAEIEEIVRRQPLAEGLGPADVQTRDEIAWELYGLPYDALSEDRQATVDERYLAQFAG